MVESPCALIFLRFDPSMSTGERMVGLAVGGPSDGRAVSEDVSADGL